MNGQNYEYTLSRPAFINVKLLLEGAETSQRFDVYEEWRLLVIAQKEPSEEIRWRKIRERMASKFGVGVDKIAENLAVEFHNTIINLGLEIQDEIKKKSASIACSLQPTPESQKTSQPGQGS